MRGTSEEHQRGPLLPLGSPSSRCRVLPSQRADHLSPAGSFPNICVVAGSLPVHMISAGGQRTKVSRGHGGDFGSGSCDQLKAGDGARRQRGEPLRTGTGGRDDHCPSHPPGQVVLPKALLYLLMAAPGDLLRDVLHHCVGTWTRLVSQTRWDRRPVIETVLKRRLR